MQVISKGRAAKMTRDEMRRAIARDVIAQVALGRMSARRGNGYVEASRPIAEMIEEESARCTVCGIGAGLVSGLRLFNRVPDNLKIDACADRDDCVDHLTDYFDRAELNLIEDAFEVSYFHSYEPKARDWLADSAAPDTVRLVCIWENIARNGYFNLDEPARVKEVTAALALGRKLRREGVPA